MKDTIKDFLFAAVLFTLALLFILYLTETAEAQWSPRDVFNKITDEEKWYVPSLETAFYYASFTGYVADALQHMHGWPDPEPKLIGRQGQWHFWRDNQLLGATWCGLILARRAIDGKLSWKGLGIQFIRFGLLRMTTTRFYKFNKYGFSSSYFKGDSRYENSLFYPKINGWNPFQWKEGCVRTGNLTPLADVGIILGLIFIKNENVHITKRGDAVALAYTVNLK